MIVIVIYLPFIATHQYGDTLTFKESQWEVGVGGYLVWASWATRVGKGMEQLSLSLSLYIYIYIYIRSTHYHTYTMPTH